MDDFTYSGGGYNVGTAEDDDVPYCRPQTTGSEPDDAVDDATDVCLSYLIISQWTGSLLGGLKCYQYCYAIFYYRVGRFGFSAG